MQVRTHANGAQALTVADVRQWLARWDELTVSRDRYVDDAPVLVVTSTHQLALTLSADIPESMEQEQTNGR